MPESSAPIAGNLVFATGLLIAIEMIAVRADSAAQSPASGAGG